MPSQPDHIDRVLAQWRHERPSLDLEPLGLAGRLFLVVQLADRQLAGGLASEGLQPGWFELLAALRRSGAPYELNPTKLMHATMLTSGGITKRLDRLEEAGLIERRYDPADRRGSLVRLTRRGRASIDHAIEAHVRNEDRILRALTRLERRSLDGLLRKLLAGLEESRGRSRSE